MTHEWPRYMSDYRAQKKTNHRAVQYSVWSCDDVVTGRILVSFLFLASLQASCFRIQVTFCTQWHLLHEFFMNYSTNEAILLNTDILKNGSETEPSLLPVRQYGTVCLCLSDQPRLFLVLSVSWKRTCSTFRFNRLLSLINTVMPSHSVFVVGWALNWPCAVLYYIVTMASAL